MDDTHKNSANDMRCIYKIHICRLRSTTSTTWVAETRWNRLAQQKYHVFFCSIYNCTFVVDQTNTENQPKSKQSIVTNVVDYSHARTWSEAIKFCVFLNSFFFISFLLLFEHSEQIDTRGQPWSTQAESIAFLCFCFYLFTCMGCRQNIEYSMRRK